MHCRFVFKDQYIELTTKLPKSADIMGLGQMIMPGTSVILPRAGTPITLWNRDLPGALAEPYTNLYGEHLRRDNTALSLACAWQTTETASKQMLQLLAPCAAAA
jgi:alpha-glucosidase (family GH31 glycosyl hydrolase)